MNDTQPSAIAALARRHFGDADMASVFASRCREHAHRPYLIWQPFDQPSVTYSYAELGREAHAVAAGLQARGVRPGDRVLVHLENSPEFVIAWFACTLAGATIVQTNTRSAEDELRYYGEDASVVGAITQPRFAALVKAAAPRLKWIACIDHDSGVRAPDVPRDESFAVLHGDPNALERRAPDPMAELAIQYTSGTTARPKGVVWTQANGLWCASVNAAIEDLRADDCHFTYLPLFHTNALGFSMLPSLWTGSRFVLVPKWSTSRFWKLSVEHRCTWVSLIGLSLRALMAMPPPRHDYRLFGTGVCADAFPNVGVKTIGWWGMTETISPGLVGSAHEPNRLLSVGKPSPHYQISVLREDGKPVAHEEAGHLLIKGVRGLSLFSGYLNRDDANEASFDAQGRFRTGDMVIPHADGFYSFVDRSKDMLRVGAENVAASEVERVITAVPGVREAAVVGRPDAKLDEVPVAFVVGGDGKPDFEARVQQACRAMLADFKVPRAVYVVREMPRSTISKVNKAELRKVALPEADRAAAERQWVDAARVDPSGDQG